MSKKVISWILYLVSLSIVVILFYRLYQYMDVSIIRIILNHPATVLFVFMCVLIFYFLLAFLWTFIVRSFHENMNPLNLMAIRSQGEFGKYLPGKIWNLVFISYAAKRDLHLKASKSVSATFIELYLSMLVLVSIILLSYHKYFIAATLLLSLLLFGYILKNYRVFVIGVALSFIAWLIALYGFYMLVQLDDKMSFSFFQTSTFFSIGQLGGMFAFFIPAGLGVKEYLVVQFSGDPNLTNSLILFRILFILAEVFRYIILTILRRKHAGQ
ncbi:MAG: hypothetical protein J7K84_11295 [Deltaproteobacteria bacterium]|nr:hypothetical protein [Deltaproteobacteria bacterium]